MSTTRPYKTYAVFPAGAGAGSITEETDYDVQAVLGRPGKGCLLILSASSDVTRLSFNGNDDYLSLNPEDHLEFWFNASDFISLETITVAPDSTTSTFQLLVW